MPSEKRQRQKEGQRLQRLEAERLSTRTQRKRQARSLFLLLAALVAVAGFIALRSGDDDETETSTEDTTTTTEGATTTTIAWNAADAAIGTTQCPPAAGADERTTTFESGPESCIGPPASYTATIDTSRGEFTVELYPDRAPKAVNSFVFLARHHFFDGVTFHRVVPGFVVQGGDATGEPPGTGGPGYEFADELPTAGPPYYEVGSFAMANSGANTNGSQFFVVTGQNGVDLPASYSLFGKVVEGMDVVYAIEATGTENGEPTEETTITSVTITES